MKLFYLAFIFIASVLQGTPMQEFVGLHVPMRKDGKIYIPKDIKHVKLDVGLSYNAPHSQHWLVREDNLVVFGFEPNVDSINSIKKGAKKLHPLHGEPLDPKFVGTRFFVFPCALSSVATGMQTFYVTNNDCGCSSLYKPKYFEVAKVVKVPVFCLSDFFDLFPFDTHPIIEYIKIDAQGSDLEIAKGAGKYLRERVVYITLEPENSQYEYTANSVKAIDEYMSEIGFTRDHRQNTSDPTYLNTKYVDYAKNNDILIFQRG